MPVLLIRSIAALLVACLLADPTTAAALRSPSSFIPTPHPEVTRFREQAFSGRALPFLSRTFAPRLQAGLNRELHDPLPVPQSKGTRILAAFFVLQGFFHILTPREVQSTLWTFIPFQILVHEILGHGFFADWGSAQWKPLLHNALFLTGAPPRYRNARAYVLVPVFSIAVGLALATALGVPNLVVLPIAANLIDLLPFPGTDLWYAIRHKSVRHATPTVESKPLRLAALWVTGITMGVPGLVSILVVSFVAGGSTFAIAGAQITFPGAAILSAMILYRGGIRKNGKLIGVFLPLAFLSSYRALLGTLFGRTLLDLFLGTDRAVQASVEGLLMWETIGFAALGTLAYAYWTQPARKSWRLRVKEQQAALTALLAEPIVDASPFPVSKSAAEPTVNALAPSVDGPQAPQIPRSERRRQRRPVIELKPAAPRVHRTQPTGLAATVPRPAVVPAAQPVQISVRYIKAGNWIKGDALFKGRNKKRLDPIIISGLQRFLNAQVSYQEGDKEAVRDIHFRTDLRGFSELSYGRHRAFFRFRVDPAGRYTVVFFVADFKGSISQNRTGNYKDELKDFLLKRFVSMSFELLEELSKPIQDVTLTPGDARPAETPEPAEAPKNPLGAPAVKHGFRKAGGLAVLALAVSLASFGMVRPASAQTPAPNPAAAMTQAEIATLLQPLTPAHYALLQASTSWGRYYASVSYGQYLLEHQGLAKERAILEQTLRRWVGSDGYGATIVRMLRDHPHPILISPHVPEGFGGVLEPALGIMMIDARHFERQANDPRALEYDLAYYVGHEVLHEVYPAESETQVHARSIDLVAPIASYNSWHHSRMRYIVQRALRGDQQAIDLLAFKLQGEALEAAKRRLLGFIDTTFDVLREETGVPFSDMLFDDVLAMPDESIAFRDVQLALAGEHYYSMSRAGLYIRAGGKSYWVWTGDGEYHVTFDPPEHLQSDPEPLVDFSRPERPTVQLVSTLLSVGTSTLAELGKSLAWMLQASPASYDSILRVMETVAQRNGWTGTTRVTLELRKDVSDHWTIHQLEAAPELGKQFKLHPTLPLLIMGFLTGSLLYAVYHVTGTGSVSELTSYAGGLPMAVVGVLGWAKKLMSDRKLSRKFAAAA